MNYYWLKQKSEEPLFPELEWNKPERRDQAGRLLLIGGHLENLNAPAKSYELVKKEGIGDVKVVLPDKTRRLLEKSLPEALFLPSTVSGELARDGLDEIMGYVAWADTILIPGDLGRNSQTTMLLADIISHCTNQLVITRDGVDALQNTPSMIFDRERTTIVASFSQLQNLMKHMQIPTPLTFNMGLVKFVEFVHEFTLKHPAAIVTLFEGNLVVALNGQVSTTKTSNETKWRIEIAARAACHQTWQPNKTFEALTHSST